MITDVIPPCYWLIISIVITDVIERITGVIRTMPKNSGNHLPRRSFAQAVSAFSKKNALQYTEKQ